MAKTNKVLDSLPMVGMKLCVQSFAAEVLVGTVQAVYDDAILLETEKKDLVIVFLNQAVYMWEFKEGETIGSEGNAQ